MNSEGHCQRAIDDALSAGKALLKFVSPNDVGQTGSHQYGFYLPKSVWKMFTPGAPEPGENHKHFVEVCWQGDHVTESVVTWYGRGTRSEYRLTRFGRDFPFLNEDSVGSLLVLIPVSLLKFNVYIFDREEDMEDVQASLATSITGRWAVYSSESALFPIAEGDCIQTIFDEFLIQFSSFPTGDEFSSMARNALLRCVNGFLNLSSDEQLVRAVEEEYRLFRLAEQKICGPAIHAAFQTIDDFLKTASSIMNRRKARAGRAFENHAAEILQAARIPFERQPPIDGRPDIIVPDARAYHDSSFPEARLFLIGLKTTCKDRWRQVLNEGARVPTKHILTLQQGISVNQLREMADSGVRLVVPKSLHRDYPPQDAMSIQTVEEFIEELRKAHPV